MVKRDGLTGLEYVRLQAEAQQSSSPMGRTLGVRFLDVAEGAVTLAFLPGPEFQGNGRVHGGALAAFTDVAMAAAVSSSLSRDQRASTLDLNITFLEFVPAGVALIAQARVLQKRRTVALAEVRIVNADGVLHAHGKGTFTVRTPAG